MSIQELIEKYKTLEAEWCLKSLDQSNSGPARLASVGFASIFKEALRDLETLQSEHKAEIEALERKAWECSVEMMVDCMKEIDDADKAEDRGYGYVRRNGLADGYKYAAYKLREAFSFPKSETPEKFKK